MRIKTKARGTEHSTNQQRATASKKTVTHTKQTETHDLYSIVDFKEQGWFHYRPSRIVEPQKRRDHHISATVLTVESYVKKRSRCHT